jgi:hypothetical protein
MNRLMETLSRVSAATLLLRGITFVFTLIAAILAIPSFAFDPRLLAVAVVAALAVAAGPGTRVVSIVLGAAVLGWLIGYLGRLQELSALQVVVFGGALFLAHSSATLAAVVPTDAVVSPEVLIRWYGRALAIVAASAVLALVLIAGASMVAGLNGTFVASLVGLAAGAALVGVLVRQARR